MLLGIFPLVYITRSRHRAAKERGPKQARDAVRDDERLADALKKFDY